MVDGSNGPDRISHLAEHLRHMRRQGRSQRTIDARVKVLGKLADWLEIDPATATEDQLERWQDTLLAKSENWCRWCTSIASPYYSFIQDRGYRPDDPTRLLVVPPAKTRLPRPMTEPDVMHAIGQAPPHILPWLLLAGWCGLRAAEIARLNGEDFAIDPDDRVWIDVVGKGGRARRVPVPLWMWETLGPYIPSSGPCWTMPTQPWRQVTPEQVSQRSANYLRGEGITLTLHSLRHRVGTQTLRATKDLRVVQELLGHAKLDTAKLYTAVEPQDVADALDQIPQPRQAHGEVHRLRPRAVDG